MTTLPSQAAGLPDTMPHPEQSPPPLEKCLSEFCDLDLELITHKWEQKVGEGGFGVVYKGVMPPE